jgi:hypothetical protein
MTVTSNPGAIAVSSHRSRITWRKHYRVWRRYARRWDATCMGLSLVWATIEL